MSDFSAGVTSKICECCHSPFHPKRAYATLCPPCFNATMEKRICPRCISEFWTRKSHPPEQPCKTCLPDCYQEALQKIKCLKQFTQMGQSAREGSVSFSADLLRDLLFLAHPDKHGNSERATRTTQKLLELRSQQKGAA